MKQTPIGRHPALPEKMTVEQLATWMTENALDKRQHVTKIDLTAEEIHEHEGKIRGATAALYDLQDLEKQIKNTIKKGNGETPMEYTIPPTKGTETLDANRRFSDHLLKMGYKEDITHLYGIPYQKRLHFFDIEGKEFFDEPWDGDKGPGLFDSEENLLT